MKRLYILILSFISIYIANPVYAAAWKLKRSFWTDQDEKAYSDFVEKICDSKYGNLNKFIKDPKANPFYGIEDKQFNLSPDCADLPYLIRAYVAYKLRLPFSYVSEISGKGGDERYSKGNKPTQFKDQDYFSSPQQLFNQVTLVNSGYYRMSVTSETSDHYPIKISPKNLTPGTIYYDPDGHVALVAKVFDNGRIRLIDAHPDKSISKPWFGSKFTRGNKYNGGGFKKWRQIRYTSDSRIIRTQNHNLKDYSATDQYEKYYSTKDNNQINYYDYVRIAMTKTNGISDPMADFIFMMQDIYEDIKYRAIAVEVAIKKGCHLKPHPGKLPYNIYGTDGIWEELSTPSRDARLKVAFREFYDNVRKMILNTEKQNPQLAKAWAYNFLLKYNELSPKFYICYTNSAGSKVILNFDEVSSRLFDLSFDPYHSIEYRWGAKGKELATANDGETKKQFYILEKRLRNQLERKYGCNTPLTMGPDEPISVDIKSWLYSYVNGNKIDRAIIAFKKESIENQPINEEKIEDKIQLAMNNNKKSIDNTIINNNNESSDKKIKLEEEKTVNADYINVSLEKQSVNTAIINRKPVTLPFVNQTNNNIVVQNINDNEIKNSNIEITDNITTNDISKNTKTEITVSITTSDDSNAKIIDISNSDTDFWSSLLIKGDKFAATISNKNNYKSIK